MSTTALLPSLARKQFRGVNDPYSGLGSYSTIPQGTLQEALAGIAPYSVEEGLISDEYREDAVSRLSRYRKAWDFYNGAHYENPWDDGEEKAVVNFIKKVVDSSVDWFVADGWCATSSTGNELIAELINACWEYNNRKKITETAVQFGAITGDVYFYVTIDRNDTNGDELPEADWKVSICPLNPSKVFPFWNPDKPGEIKACLLQYTQTNDGGKEELVSLFIEPKRWRKWINEKLEDEQENPFGRVNVVHIPNFVLANSSFGQSDIHQVVPINVQYNNTLNRILRIIDYHAEPTTIVYGARVGDLDRGSKRIWSNLPPHTEAKIENLELKSELKATYDLLATLEALICQLSNTPKILFEGQGFSVSNTSGLAMQMMFQPIIEKTRKRRVTYEEGIKRLNELVIIGHTVLGMDLTALADDPTQIYTTEVEFTSPLPRDEQAELDAATKKVEMGVWSVAEAIRRLGGVKDQTRLILELAADTRQTLMLQYETQRANMGLEPNPSVAFLGSAALSEDFEKVAADAQPSALAPSA